MPQRKGSPKLDDDADPAEGDTVAVRGKHAGATTAVQPQDFFGDGKTLAARVHDLHDALCDHVQALSVRRKKPVLQLMARVAGREDRCAVFAEDVGLPLGWFAAYRLLKGATR
jgi:hypothetical protein